MPFKQTTDGQKSVLKVISFSPSMEQFPLVSYSICSEPDITEPYSQKCEFDKK